MPGEGRAVSSAGGAASKAAQAASCSSQAARLQLCCAGRGVGGRSRGVDLGRLSAKSVWQGAVSAAHPARSEEPLPRRASSRSRRVRIASISRATAARAALETGKSAERLTGQRAGPSPSSAATASAPLRVHVSNTALLPRQLLQLLRGGGRSAASGPTLGQTKPQPTHRVHVTLPLVVRSQSRHLRTCVGTCVSRPARAQRSAELWQSGRAWRSCALNCSSPSLLSSSTARPAARRARGLYAASPESGVPAAIWTLINGCGDGKESADPRELTSRTLLLAVSDNTSNYTTPSLPSRCP